VGAIFHALGSKPSKDTPLAATNRLRCAGSTLALSLTRYRAELRRGAHATLACRRGRHRVAALLGCWGTATLLFSPGHRGDCVGAAIRGDVPRWGRGERSVGRWKALCCPPCLPFSLLTTLCINSLCEFATLLRSRSSPLSSCFLSPCAQCQN